MPTEYCLFCPIESETLAGSREHVFLSAIGGRIVTRRVVCAECNNKFSPWDDEISKLCLLIRNALNILSGRDEPPPTIRNAYRHESGHYFDLAPSLTPVPQRARVPPKDFTASGSSFEFSFPDMKDIVRVLDIFGKRKLDVQIASAKHVSQQLPGFYLPISMRVDEGFRSIAKLAVAAVCVLYSNEIARTYVQGELRRVALDLKASIRDFVAFGYDLEWVKVSNKRRHTSNLKGTASDFDHSVTLLDVGNQWIAYIELFGGYRFIVVMGAKSGLQPQVLIVNPMSSICSRFEADVTPPSCFRFPSEDFPYTVSLREIESATQRALEWSYEKGRIDNAKLYSEELLEKLSVATTEADREKIIELWAEKLATLESGNAWEVPVDTSFDHLA